MASSTRTVRILLTASEAYPALERAFLAAKDEIWAAFQVFDLGTPLLSPEARQIGRSWQDLLRHLLGRGVALHVTLSAFDPLLHPAAHRLAVRQRAQFRALQEAEPGLPLHLRYARHPAQAGLLTRVALWPAMLGALWRAGAGLNALEPSERPAALAAMDHAARHFHLRRDGLVALRPFGLPRLFPVTHRQNLAVIDRRYLFIGGLDIDPRRVAPSGPQRQGEGGAHDVQLMIEGPVVTEAQQHLESFLEMISDNAPGPKSRRLLRTLSRPRSLGLINLGPQPVVEDLRSAHLVLARRATGFVYLESPGFADRELALALAEAARREPGLQMILILPALAQGAGLGLLPGLDARLDALAQSRALGILRRAFGPRLFIGAPARPAGAHPAPVDAPALPCVNARVSVFDDKSAIVSSANLSRRALRWDTEAGVYLAAHNDVQELRHRVMAHWLPKDSPESSYDPATAVGAWRRIAWANAATAPASRPTGLLPHEVAAAEALGRIPPRPPADLA